MSLANALTQLQTVLAADTALIAWAQDNFNREWTELKANRLVVRLEPKKMPVRIYELMPAETGPEVSNYSQEVLTHIALGVGWYNDDYESAFDQLTALLPLVIQAVMANPTLNGVVDGAWVTKFTPDQSVNHPKHFATFEVAIEYKVNNP